MATVIQSGTNSIDQPITLGSPVTAGNALIAIFLYRFDVDVTVSDNRSNTYESPLGYIYTAGSESTVKIIFCANTAAGSTTLTPGGAASLGGGSWVAMEVSGLATSSIVDASAEIGILDTTTPYEPGVNVTATQANTFLVVGISDMQNNGNTCTGVAGDITSFSHLASGRAYGYATLASSGVKNAALTFNGPDTYAVQAYAFAPAGGGGGGQGSAIMSWLVFN